MSKNKAHRTFERVTACAIKKGGRAILRALLAAFLGVTFSLVGARGSVAATSISEKQARDIALSHAGVEESSLSSMKVKREHDDGRLYYEIKFQSLNMEYEYDIDAVTGTVLEFERKEKWGGGYQTSPARSGAYIGEEQARTIALQHAGVPEAEARIVKLTRYDKRGQMLYDIEFLTKSAKYSYEIDARTGDVASFYRKGT